MMRRENNHIKMLNNDLNEACNPLRAMLIDVKLIYYLLQRPLAHYLLKNYLLRHRNGKMLLNFIDGYLLNEGGMFKKHVYNMCDYYSSLKGSVVCVPGIGYGKNLPQLAAFRPKQIIAFDFYEYPEEWEFLKRTIKDKFSVEVDFHKVSSSDIAERYKNYFDFVITDAVLEHVKDLTSFAHDIKNVLKNNGIFYASFGPIWYGPCGDHIYWGDERIFDHILISKEKYNNNFEDRFKDIKEDSTDGAFIVRNDLFSFLPAKEYFEILSETGFEKIYSCAKISTKAISLFRQKPELHDNLDNKNVPLFDRYCSGLYLWMRACK